MLEPAPPYQENSRIISLLVKLQQRGELKKIQDNYLYWDKLKYRPGSENALDLWSAVKLERKLKGKSIRFGQHRFSYVLTDYIHRALHQFDLHIGGNLASNTGIAETDKTKFILSSIMEEAISSSQMEGANTTRKEAKEMIQREQKPQTKSEMMILNNFTTINHIVQHKQEELTAERILFIHQLISRNTLDDPHDEGRFRDNDEVKVVNHTNNEIVYAPPAESELADLIHDLCHFFNTDTDDFIHPIIKGCVIHFMIGWIHPFTDGNGRTARAIFYWYMLKKGYWLTEFLSISRIIKGSKNQYEKAYQYTEADANDLSYFITYHIRIMEKAYEALKQYISKRQKEVNQAARFMKIPAVNERMAQLIKIMYDDPDRIFNIKEIENRFSISNFTARSDLKNLVELGFLEIIQVNKIKQNFIRSENFNTLIHKYLD